MQTHITRVLHTAFWVLQRPEVPQTAPFHPFRAHGMYAKAMQLVSLQPAVVHEQVPRIAQAWAPDILGLHQSSFAYCTASTGVITCRLSAHTCFSKHAAAHHTFDHCSRGKTANGSTHMSCYRHFVGLLLRFDILCYLVLQHSGVWWVACLCT